MQDAPVLIVDDEPDIRDLIALTLQRMNIESDTAENVTQARGLLEKKRFGLCLTDMRLPDGTGLDLIKHVQENVPNLPIAVITAFGSMETAVEALKSGAFDFISKPVRLEDLRNLVTSALKLPEKEKASKPSNTERTLIGDSQPMAALKSMIGKVARSQAPIHITGQSGTGKELVARMIHEKGSRAEGDFVAVNCGAIPSELMESEFFGHKKGAFTGAIADNKGLFEAAHRGTLFLDEVADLPNAMQVKLLRVIQEKSVRPVGATVEKSVDVRILSATHKDLAKLVQEEKFREDLYYRINVIELHAPSLRERPEDIGPISEFILKKIADRHGGEPKTISEPALKALMSHKFSGNVRELENKLERAVILSSGEQIETEDLALLADFKPEPGNAVAESPAALPDEINLDDHLAEIERKLIERALTETNNNKTAAAKRLGISFRSLRYKLDKMGIE